MKKNLAIFLLFFVTLLTAQDLKHLTLEDAVMGFYKDLYPEQKSLQWVDQTDDYILIENEVVYIQSASHPELERRAPVLSLDDLQKVIPSLKSMPTSFTKITSEEIYFTHNNSFFRYHYKSKIISNEISFPEEAENIDVTSGPMAVAYTIDNNLYVANSSKSKIVVTNSEDKDIVSGQAIARSEFGIRKGTFWSPDGNHLAFYQKDESNVTNYPLVDVTTTPATLENIKYPMNGMGSEVPKVGVFSVQKKSVIYLDIDTSDEHYLTNLSWSPDGKYIFLAEINRDQDHMWYTMYNAESGKKEKTLFEEKNDKWVEPEHIAVFIPESSTTFLWMSERDGFMNIYVYDIQKGFIKQLTNYQWVVNSILGFDETEKHVIITGTGSDPRENKAFKVNLKTGKTEDLTKEAGSHRVHLSSNGNYLIDSYSSLDVPGVLKIKSIQKKKERELFRAPNPIKDYQLGTTEFVTLRTKNGIDLFGRIVKPANFDPNKKYPVLIYVYGGPHAQLVTNSWMGGSNLWMQWMAAEKDYIMFTLDNRGSASRGFEFESVIHRQLGEKEMEDQLTGVTYLNSLPYVDGNRLAVHGWSYGGFMTNSLMLRHPDVFSTAVAGGPVTDWKWYEIMYGERYMDRWQDNVDGFEKSRVHNYVQNLNGKLMEVIGSVDPVVVPQHTMTLLKSFVENKKQVDFLSYPMHPHNVRGIDRAHLMKKILDYVIENNQ